MKTRITPDQIKQNNRSLIYHLIYQSEKTSQQDIAAHLSLSRPTVAANLTELEKCGLIRKNGLMDTDQVGRKASAYSIVPDYRIGIGAEILRDSIRIIAVDLYGRKTSLIREEIRFEKSQDYYKNICGLILRFIDTLNVDDDQILGIGFAMQGLVTPDRRRMLYGRILDCTGLSIEEFSGYLPFPCSFIHDSESAAISELWASPGLEDAFYLSISEHLGAAVISKGKILAGKHGHSATVEHIQMRQNGPRCYCGRYGCMETMISLSSLLHDGEDPETFFKKLRGSDPDVSGRWDDYLTCMAQSIGMLHLVYDTDFIIGGYLAQYIQKKDINIILSRITPMTPFSEDPDFIRVSKMPRYNIAIGAALPYIQDFLSRC